MAMASGRHGQTLVVLPAQDALLVMTGKAEDRFELALNVPALVRTHLLPAFRRGSLPPNGGGLRRLRDTTLRMSAAPAMTGIAKPVTARLISGKRYVFGRNNQNISSVKIELPDAGVSAFTLAWRSPAATEGEVPLKRPFGEGRYVLSEPTTWGTFASRGRWIDANTLEIQTEALQSSTTTRLQFRFTGDTVEIDMKDNDGVVDLLSGKLQ
jgi:hypothetical protein